MTTTLPIEAKKDDILSILREKKDFCLLLSAPTGSGKSTRVPLYLHEAGCTHRGMVLVVQPRRLAARLLASYVAKQWGCRLGDDVGYAVRHDSCYRASTSLLFVTDGVLERWMGRDASLEGVAAIVFDEVHERRLSGDLCLARALQLQKESRPDLGLVIMSASLELDKLHDYLPQASLVEAQGRIFPVDISYQHIVPRRDARGAMTLPPLWEQVTDATKQLVAEGESGDFLVFLPGVYEIRRCEEQLLSAPWLRGWDIFTLHGQLSPEQQQAAVQCSSVPRVILSTNIAETSLTIEGVRAVIDTGMVRESRWEALRGLSSLHLVPISQAQADQRAGRAGRVQAGRCLRLWSEAEQHRRAPFPLPEIHRADLSAAFLNLLSWGHRGLEGVMDFPWPEAPKEQDATVAWHQLQCLGALTEEGGLSPIGDEMRSYALPPVLSRLLIAGKHLGCEAEMAAIAALLSGEKLSRAEGLHEGFWYEGDYSDFQAEWRALRYASQQKYDSRACTSRGIMARAARETMLQFRQLCPTQQQPDFERHQQSICQALLLAMPEHVAALNSRATLSARLIGKKAAKLNTPLLKLNRSTDILLAAEMVEIGAKEVLIRLSRCTLLSPDMLACAERSVAVYDSTRKRVINKQQLLYRDELILSEKECGEPAPEAAAALLAEQVIKGKLLLKNWDGHVLQWLYRLRCLRAAMPELELPDFSDDDKQVALTMLCEGASTHKEIESRPVLPILKEWLSGWQRDCLDRHAPRSIKLSNGREVKLLYKEDGTPSFGIKCQLLFGVRETPRIAEGRVNCLVEILAPNMRPYQVTSDLASFWKNGYPQMKKDLAGRYPRHDWSEQ